MRFITIALLAFVALSTRNPAEENANLLRENRVLMNALKELQVGADEAEVGFFGFSADSTIPSWMKEFTNPDGQKCQFERVPDNQNKMGEHNRNCGWDGADSKYQKKFWSQHINECVAECKKHQWCNFAFNDGGVNGGFQTSWCYLYNTCNDQTTHPMEGHLARKECPRTPVAGDSCKCSGHKNDQGKGGPNCSGAGNNGKPWCYVSKMSTCTDARQDSRVPWSEQACKGSEREATVGGAGGWTQAEIENIKNSGRGTFYIGSSNFHKQWWTPATSNSGTFTDNTFDLSAFKDKGYMTHAMQEYKQCTGKEMDLKKWFEDNVQRGNITPENPEQCSIMCASYGKAGCCEWQYDHMGCRFKTATLKDNKAYDRFFKKGQRWAAMIEKMPEPGCTDDWADEDGDDCDFYARNQICKVQYYSSSGVTWGTNFSTMKGGSLNDWTDRFGRSAHVCKACGCGQGGHRHPGV